MEITRILRRALKSIFKGYAYDAIQNKTALLSTGIKSREKRCREI
jgi:hypothetical protein